jgi:NADH:ubiquinone oxidoreductase subunit E
MSNEGKIPNHVIYVCTGKSCKKKGGKDISKYLKDRIKESGLKNSVEIVKNECTDRCKTAPNVCFQPQNSWLALQNIPEIERHLTQIILSKVENTL